MRFHWWLAALAWVAVRPAAAVDAGAAQILYFESLHISVPAAARAQQKTSSRELQFDAYGRRFVLSLEPNDKLSPLLQSKSGAAPVQLYRGQINGASESWARIAITDGRLHGMLWDGAELYVIEPLATLGDSLPADTPTDDSTTAIFRLADVVMTPGATSCGTDTSVQGKGNEAYGSLVQELKSAPAIMQAAGATRRLEISALGDGLFLNRYGAEPRARTEILLRLNNVDGIYSSQLGVEIQVPSIDIGDSLSATTVAESLLKELGSLRRRSPNLYSRGLTHLFTGRDLDNNFAGIAFVNRLCDREFGAGLTEASGSSSWIESLIAAHEIGHNFGAVHDGDPDKACADTPGDRFLMSPNADPNNYRFSSCSLGVMQPNAAAASCITALPPADIAVAANLGVVRKPVGRAFDWNLTVSNAGGLTTANARAEILVPPVVFIEDAYVVGGSCTSGAGRILCQLGDIAGGNSNVVHLSLRSDVVGSNSVSVEVSADNDFQASNNSGDGTLSIEPEADLAVSLQAPATVAAGSSFDVTLTATNLSVIDANAATLSLDLPAGVTATSATLNGMSCSLQTGTVSCSLPSLAAGATVTGAASLTAAMGGDALLLGRISGSYVDPVASNDVSEVTVSVTSTLSTTTRSGGSGGGGSSGALLLSALLGLLGLKSLRGRTRR